ncbi:ADP-ribosylhydrolase ARH1-like [Mercenaria mercenaria]|uniref:ADP-ribosylhydrolase ARH1-like n=1 Tax=Mercenaria mercenaria TaxID=6596 RepID=UPI00234E726C|nr:ADP-ribosylhydrolase ARH1-like [Mercenaria mercenaria]
MCDNSGKKSTGRGKPRFTIPSDILNVSRDNYIAGMVLSGVGDALGYKNGEWEMCRSGRDIHKEVNSLGGIKNIILKPPQWIVSDDTIMHLATADALVKYGENNDKEKLYSLLAEEYKKSMKDMNNRLVGLTCQAMCMKLDPLRLKGYRIPFNLNGGGCGAAMRSMCIGLRYPRPDEIAHLISISVEAGRMTHHHPTGYLGSLASALFVSYAVQQKGMNGWGAGLLETLPAAKTYIQSCDTGFENENQREWYHFEEKLTEYLRIRGLLDGKRDPKFPPNFGVEKRDQFYAYLSFDGVGGNSGYDAPLIAYDALLGCNGNWEELCGRAMFHSGDSDSTGVIAGCLYGIVFGLKNVPVDNYKYVEYYSRLEDTASKLYNLALKV